MPDSLDKYKLLIDSVLSSLKRPKTDSVLTFESPFSVLVMDRGFAMTETLVAEIKSFLVEQGIDDPVKRISAVTSFTTDLGRLSTVSKTNTRLMVFHGEDGLEIVFFVGTSIEDHNA